MDVCSCAVVMHCAAHTLGSAPESQLVVVQQAIHFHAAHPAMRNSLASYPLLASAPEAEPVVLQQATHRDKAQLLAQVGAACESVFRSGGQGGGHKAHACSSEQLQRASERPATVLSACCTARQHCNVSKLPWPVPASVAARLSAPMMQGTALCLMFPPISSPQQPPPPVEAAPATRCGCRCASSMHTSAPAEWPTATTRPTPSASSRPARSSRRGVATYRHRAPSGN